MDRVQVENRADAVYNLIADLDFSNYEIGFLYALIDYEIKRRNEKLKEHGE